MKNPFKRKQITEYRHVYTGKVQFVKDGKIHDGEIFGTPFTPNLIGGYYYHVRTSAGVVYDVAHHAIEEVRK